MTKTLCVLFVLSTFSCGGSPEPTPVIKIKVNPTDTVPPTIRWDQAEYTSTMDFAGQTQLAVSATLVNGSVPLPSGVNIRMHPLTKAPFCQGTASQGCPRGGAGSIEAWVWPRAGTPWHSYTGSIICPDDWLCGELDCTENGCSIGIKVTCTPESNSPFYVGDQNFPIQIDYVDQEAFPITSDTMMLHCVWP
jgi:hypothetical protein